MKHGSHNAAETLRDWKPGPPMSDPTAAQIEAASRLDESFLVRIETYGVCASEDDATGVRMLIAEIRASWREIQQLRAALQRFADDRSPVSAQYRRCDSDTGYCCGTDSDGVKLPGFTDWCRWCAVRLALGLSLDTYLGPVSEGKADQ